jgi:germination protein M
MPRSNRKFGSVRTIRVVAVLVILAVVGYGGYRVVRHFTKPKIGDTITVYYSKADGETLAPWTVTLGSARDTPSVAFYAATQAVAGPASDVEAIRFPSGTIVRHVDVSDGTATVDLSGNVAAGGGGSFAESGEFKALIWSLTAVPSIKAVQIRVDGRKVPTLPGGHLELDEPLSRSSW